MTTTGYKISTGVDIGSVFSLVSNGSPTGSIIAYLGTTDVSGWIICNGVTRTNNSDSRYNGLNSLGIGSGGSGTTNYTPPNLTNRFLYGASSTLNQFSGSSSVTLDVGNIPTHSHSGTTNTGQASINIGDPGHAHQLYSTGNEYARAGGGLRDQVADADGFDATLTNYAMYTASAHTNITVTDSGHSHSFSTSSVGSGTSFSILPSHYTVNYIIKL
jgi:microcystin-dependent protein